jgi:antitoxin (DNA-binding transcriptional repressor) of toxin-antitoxin stability system
MAVIQVTSREFREKQASMFALADKGEQVVIRRRGKASYMLTPVYDDDFVLSPEVEGRLEEGRRQYRAGNVKSFSTKEELERFLDEL